MKILTEFLKILSENFKILNENFPNFTENFRIYKVPIFCYHKATFTDQGAPMKASLHQLFDRQKKRLKASWIFEAQRECIYIEESAFSLRKGFYGFTG